MGSILTQGENSDIAFSLALSRNKPKLTFLLKLPLLQAHGVIGPNVFLTDELRHKRPTGVKERAVPRRGGGGGAVSGKSTATPATGE